MSVRRSPFVAAVVVGIVVGTIAVVVSNRLIARAGETESAPRDVVLLQFDGAAGALSAPIVSGTARVRASVLIEGTSQAVLVPGRRGQGTAVSLPSPDGGNAVVVVRNGGTSDELAPMARGFTFGADFRTDEGSGADGDNVIQRGLNDDVGQMKLEVDYGRPACTVKGASGQVIAIVQAAITAHTWYRVTCDREGDRVSAQLTDLETAQVWTAVVTGETGEVRTDRAATPLTVGGKVSPDGSIADWQPDQFNGEIDNAFLRWD